MRKLNMSPLRIFVSYSHQDESYLSELEKHLTTLKRENLIDTWHDRKIISGRDWEKEIDGALQDSDIIVFLISPDFVASEYCIEKEVAAALQKHNCGEAIVIPIIVRPTDWLSTPLGKIQALPKDAKPISVWPNKDVAWLEVVKGIRFAISDLSQKKIASSSKIDITSMPVALTSLIEKLEVRYERSENIGGLSSGLYKLDHLIDGIHPGDLICVAASPVMDRMALLISITNEVFAKKSHLGLFVTLRQSKEQITRRMCAAVGNISVHAMQRGMLADDDWGNLTHALGRLNDANIGIIEESSIDINILISQIDKIIKLNGHCDLVLIDQFEHVTGATKPILLSILGRYARKNRVPIIVATGLEFDTTSRPNKRPVLKDVGEWAVLNEDLDVVVFVYQDGQYNPDSPDKGVAELIVAKNSRGPLGTVNVVYLGESQTFVNVPKGFGKD
jgi:replicative DNA helicase